MWWPRKSNATLAQDTAVSRLHVKHVVAAALPSCDWACALIPVGGEIHTKELPDHTRDRGHSVRNLINGTENRPFASICQRYLLMFFVTKTETGERPSKARSFDFGGLYVRYYLCSCAASKPTPPQGRGGNHIHYLIHRTYIVLPNST
jgi:hypothetical protein